MSLYSTGVRQIIDDYLVEESKKERDYGDYWSASSAGYCMRKNIFKRLGVPEVNEEDRARLQRVFTAGHLFHEWIQDLTKKAGCSVEQEGELIDDKIMVKGHFDDLIIIKNHEDMFQLNEEQYKDWLDNKIDIKKDKLILYDYKTANSRSFNYKKEMSHFHKMQLGTYLYMARKQKYSSLSEARILIIEKDTLRTREFVLDWTPDLEKQVVEYWQTLNGYWNNKKLPKCTCDKYEGGFMAKEKWNPYYYDGEPCSVAWYKKWKEENEVNV